MKCPFCENGAKCHHVTGSCQCTAGFTGERCHQQCESGLFGLNCSSSCECPPTDICDPVNGTCQDLNIGAVQNIDTGMTRISLGAIVGITIGGALLVFTIAATIIYSISWRRTLTPQASYSFPKVTTDRNLHVDDEDGEVGEVDEVDEVDEEQHDMNYNIRIGKRLPPVDEISTLSSLSSRGTNLENAQQKDALMVEEVLEVLMIEEDIVERESSL